MSCCSENKRMTDCENTLSTSQTDTDGLLRRALDVGEAMLKCGAEIRRVEETVTRICRAYGAVHVEVFTIITLINAAVRMPDGSYSSQIRRIYASVTDLGRLEQLNALSRRVCATTPPLAEVDDALRQIKATRSYPGWLTVLAAALGCGAFAVFCGGSVRDGLAATVAGAVLGLGDRFCPKLFNEIAKTLLLAVLGGLLSCATVAVGIGENADYVMIGTIMLLIPGMALGTALRDLLSDDTLSGLMRLMRSLLLAVIIALGYTVGIVLLRTPAEPQAPQSPLLTLLSCLLVGITFSLRYQVHPKRLVFAAGAAVLGVAVYLPMPLLTDSMFLAYLIPAAAVAVYAEVCARLLHAPAPIFTVPGILPLVPGAYLYRAMRAVITSDADWAGFLAEGSGALRIALGIAAGCAAVTLMAMVFSRLRRYRHKGKS